MSTGSIENFTGNIAEIGPMYPFVGTEWLLASLCLVFWLAWHVLQIRVENRELEVDAARYVTKEILDRVYEREEIDPGVQ